jgi:hypothetical protein
VHGGRSSAPWAAPGIAATIAAHDLALRTRPPGRTARGQIPIATATVALTCAGLFALLSG